MTTRQWAEYQRQADVIEQEQKRKENMEKKEYNVNELLNVIKELEAEMWYQIHNDKPHNAHMVKTWVDAIKAGVNHINNKNGIAC